MLHTLSRMPRKIHTQLLACALMAGAFLAGCRTTPVREESFSRPFEAQKVARLSHEAYKVAWHATYWANHDLCFAPFDPTVLEWEAVGYLNDITWRVSWIARKVEKNPATPRVSSKYVHDVVAYDTMMLRRRYERTSFKPSTAAQIEHLLSLLDEIAPYYAQNQQAETLKAETLKGSSGKKRD